MSRQVFVNYFVADNLRERVRESLQSFGFAVSVGQRLAGPALVVRVRQDTEDAGLVDQLVRELAPEASKGPSTAPTKHLDDYRERL